jgi:hypothetical protein
MAEDIKIASFHFKKSGNSCDVYVESDPDYRSQIQDIRVEWDSFPPTPLDAKLWSRRYLPLVLRKIAELIGGPVAGIRTVVSPGDPVVFQVDKAKGPKPSRPN